MSHFLDFGLHSLKWVSTPSIFCHMIKGGKLCPPIMKIVQMAKKYELILFQRVENKLRFPSNTLKN